jgi:rRNA pseudouridine-1189 N-methylase Emg1 (Nep1/Mra1 family)
VQVYGDNAMKKTAVYKWVKLFLREEKVKLRRDKDGQQEAELKKTLQKFVKLCVKIFGCQQHSRASEHRQKNREILTEDLDMRKVCAKMVPKELTKEQKQRRVFSY